MENRVLMVAAENDGLRGGKVGGIGDVVRDVPIALARLGWDVDVVTPSYGFLNRMTGAQFVATVSPSFGGEVTRCDVHSVPGKRTDDGVRHLVIDHPTFLWLDRGRPQIYRNDPPESPFASDASKFALFCKAVAEAALQGLFGSPICIHLHDWHAAFFLILRKYDQAYRDLLGIPTAYTIHNLALQGIRPLQGHPSSLAAWYPSIVPSGDVTDPRWPNCLNPMAVGIRLADNVHTVSPSYAAEILKPSDVPRYYGGEGLETDLAEAKKAGRLFGILNGCEYPEGRAADKLPFHELLQRLRSDVLRWIANESVASSAHIIALERLTELSRVDAVPSIVCTSVTRVVDQKVFLLYASGSADVSGLQGILESLGDTGVYILLGTGERTYEDFLVKMSAQHRNFVFMNGYSDASASALYGSGDLFLMPSSFEPCGISQMLAMRDGQPCVVHGVGGLKDTVLHGLNGFVFGGDTVKQQVDGLNDACRDAIALKSADIDAWSSLRTKAAAARFVWDKTVSAYARDLYQRTA